YFPLFVLSAISTLFPYTTLFRSRWFQSKIEVPHQELTRSEQGHILGRLNAAEAFETFLQTKYIGQKRFSLEGGESAIVLLDEILNQSADTGLDEVAIGMAH